MNPVQDADSDREALIRLCDVIAGGHPRGPIARLKRRWQLRQVQGCLDREEALAAGIDPVAAPRRYAAYGIVTLFGFNAGYVLLFSHRALSLGRVFGVLVGFMGLAGLFLAALPWLYQYQGRGAEREYQRWLQRARQLSSAHDRRSIGPSDAAV